MAELLYCTIEEHCIIVNSDGVVLDLTKSSKPDITDFLLTTWNNVVTIEVLKRKSWQEIDTVDIVHTMRQMQKLSNEERALIKRYMTGAVQNPTMQVHWKPKEDVACVLCGANQPRLLHDQLDCPNLEKVREEWSPWLSLVEETQQPYLAFPVAPQLDLEIETLHTRARHLLPLPDITCQTDHSRLSTMARWNSSFVLPDSFKVMQVGFTTGKQTVNRAELTAVCMAIRCYPSAVTLNIYSDSQYAVELVRKVYRDPEPNTHWSADNFDLVLQLCHGVQNTSAEICIQKIKSHQDILSVPTLLGKYYAIGNHCADAAASSRQSRN